MTKKSKLVPKSLREISGKTVDRLTQKSKVYAPDLNAKVKKTYLNPRFND